MEMLCQIFGTISKGNSSSNKPKVTIPKPGDKIVNNQPQLKIMITKGLMGVLTSVKKYTN
jgi:hypothetical protein